MWALNNRTSYAAERNWIRDKRGTHLWLVAVKATFDIAPNGRIQLADEQVPPVLEPEYRGDPAASSLRVESDLLATKSTTDILVDASAHAPKGKPAGSVQVSLRVGDVAKMLVVHGLRVYYEGALGLATSTPQLFTTQPIHYEWAFGGTDMENRDPSKHRIDSRNPVGKGFAVDRKRLVNQVAHKIEYPSGGAAKTGPAGFGPIASFWSPRLERAGTYGDLWQKSKKPFLPDDYDDRFAQAAPDDQRPAKPLRGGETVNIVHMTPGGVLRFDLPKIFLAFRTRIADRFEEHRATLATVLITLEERMQLSLVWQSVLPIPPRDIDYLDWTTIIEKEYVR